MNAELNRCPCGSALPLDSCCKAIHSGRPAATALELMRSRYSAFVLKDADYLLRTGTEAEPRGLEDSFARTRWLRLVVHEAVLGGQTDDSGVVAFSAYFEEAGDFAVLYERSRFERRNGDWRYIDGDTRVEALEPRRNDPCLCGSGKKLKQCHGGSRKAVTRQVE